jgi:acyl-CoA reductase-like NAD-dependent aldehyde dehydrogenase
LFFKAVNPADSQVVSKIREASPREVKKAVENARAAQPAWARESFDERKKILLKFASFLEKESKGLALTVTREMGKPISQSKGDAQDAPSEVRWFAEKAEKALEDEELAGNSVLSWEPLGVVAAIKPWNYPVEVPLWAIAPALMAGNSVVFKPSEITPVSGAWLANLLLKAGVPEGVLQLMQGRGKVGGQLVDSSVDCVSFTGSSKVGIEIAKKCAKTLRKSVLELGGSSPSIVFADADLRKAAKGIAGSRFGNCGQSCSAAKRVLAEKKILPEFIELLREEVEGIKVGDPEEEGTELGPLASFKQREILEAQVKDAVGKGAKTVVGGKRPSGKEFSKGAFYEPTILEGKIIGTRIWREETFGPVLPVVAFSGEEEAIKLANDTDYGLSATVWTGNEEKSERVSKEVIAGSVFSNCTWAGCGEFPWFGVKQSGWGFEGLNYGFKEFCRPKHKYKA